MLTDKTVRDLLAAFASSDPTPGGGSAAALTSAVGAATIVAAHGNPAASSDVGVAVALLRAGLEGARLNVDVNLSGIRDERYSSAVASEVRELVERVAAGNGDDGR